MTSGAFLSALGYFGAMTHRAILIGFASLLLAGCGNKPPCEDPDALVSIAQDAVASKLKSPSRAKFFEASVTPIDTNAGVTVMGESMRWSTLLPDTKVEGFTVTGHVDAPNAFGTPIRESYSIVLTCGTNTASVLHGQVGNVEWGGLYDLKKAMLKTIETQIRLEEAQRSKQ